VSTQALREAALAYLANGVSIVPINHRTKLPAFNLLPKQEDENGELKSTWKPYQTRLPTPEEVNGWFDKGCKAFALVGGQVSGGLEIIDHDEPGFYEAWLQEVEPIIEQYGIPVQRTGSGGYQAAYRCPNPKPNSKLAWIPDESQEDGRAIAIETRGEGGYAVAPLSLHPSGNYYETIRGDYTQIPTISQVIADTLKLAAARLDQAPFTRKQLEKAEQARARTEERKQSAGEGANVIDLFNDEHTIEAELERAGYTERGARYIRPGANGDSQPGVYIKDNRSFHHSTNDPLCDGYWHTPFDVFLHYEHNGDLTRAVREAAEILGIDYKSNRQSEEETQTIALTNGRTGEPYQAPEPPRKRLYHANELAELPPIKWLRHGELPAGGLAVIYAGSGEGKSFVVLNEYALPIAQERNVVYIAAEGASGYAARVDAWRKHHKLDAGGLHFYLDAVPLLNRGAVKEFIQQVTPLEPALVVVDTLARCLLGGDENSAKDMGLFIEACAEIQRTTGATVLVVHHTGKSGNSERGSSALKGAADAMLELQNDDGLITLRCAKSKDTGSFPARYMRLVQVETDLLDADGAPVVSCVVLPADRVLMHDAPLSENEREVLEVLALEAFEEAGAKASQIESAVKRVPRSSLFRILSNLKRKKLAEQAKRGDPWFITRAGLEAAGADNLFQSHGANGQSSGKSHPVSPKSQGSLRLVSQASETSSPKSHQVSHPFRGETSETETLSETGIGDYLNELAGLAPQGRVTDEGLREAVRELRSTHQWEYARKTAERLTNKEDASELVREIRAEEAMAQKDWKEARKWAELLVNTINGNALLREISAREKEDALRELEERKHAAREMMNGAGQD
jgi:hypothetical protein